MGKTAPATAAAPDDDEATRLRFAILGPLEVSLDARVVSVGGPKPRALLAMLLLHRGELMSAAALIDLLWDEAPPPSAATTLPTYVSHLRAALGRATVRGEHGGYRLEVAPEQIDAVQFERTVRELTDGRRSPRTMAARARAALSLWRGDVLSDLDGAVWVQPEAVRLEGLRQWTSDRLIDARLGLGDHARLVPELESLIASDPLREELHARLMVALYRSGRQTEALRAFERVRRQLRDVGLQPGHELVGLERSILAQADELDRPGAGSVVELRTGDPHGAQPPAVALPPALDVNDSFVGRESELAVLLDAWRDVAAGDQRLAEVIGEPGIGKTRLIAEFAGAVAATGATVLYGACTPLIHIPYEPFVAAMSGYVDALSLGERRALIDDAAWSLLARFMPEFATDSVGTPGAEREDPSVEQQRLFDAVAAFFTRISRDSPVLLVVDDAQWAAAPTLALLRDLVASAGERALLLVVARRKGAGADVEAGARAEPSEVIRLGGLTAKDVGSWLRSARPATTDLTALTERVWRQTDGVPLFVREFLVSVASLDQHDWPRGAEVGTAVEAVLDERWNALSDDTHTLLGVVAAMEPVAHKVVLEQVACLPEGWSTHPLDAALSSGFLAEAPGHRDILAFTHRLVRDYAEETLTGLQRATVHRDIARALQRVGGRDAHTLSQLARHYAVAAPLGHAGDATDTALRAAQLALETFACDDAIAILRRALDAVDGSSRLIRARRVELLLALSEAYKVDSDRASAREAAREAALEARDTDPELFARAAVVLGDWGEQGEADYETIALLRDALEALGTDRSPTRSRVLAELAGTLTLTAGDPAAARAYADEALALARELDHPTILWRALLAAVTTRLGEPRIEERLALAEEMTAVGRALDRPSLYIVGLENEQYARAELGDLSGLPAYVETLAREMEHAPAGTRTTTSGELTEAQGLRFAELPLMSARDSAFLALTSGDWARAERQIDQLGSLASNDLNYLYSYAGQLVFLRREQGRSAEILPTALETAASAADVPAFGAAVAMLAADTGDHELVRRQLEFLLRDGIDALPRGLAWTGLLTLMTEGCAAVRDADVAATLHEQLLGLSGSAVVIATLIVCTGAIDRYLGMLEAVMGDHDAADGHFRAALELENGMRSAPLAARTQYWHARMLLERDRPADRDRASDLLHASADVASGLGMHSLEVHGDALRTRFGLLPAERQVVR